MPRTVLTAQNAPGTGTPTTPAAGALVTFAAADVANQNAVAMQNGKNLVLALNTSTTTDFTVTITSVADTFGRTGDITAFSVTHNAGGNALAMFGPFSVQGWQQGANGQLFFQASNAAVQFAVINLP